MAGEQSQSTRRYDFDSLELLACCLTSIVLLTNCEAEANTLHTVALSGDPAPGGLSGVFFHEFEAPVMNSAGKVAFHAVVTGSNVGTSNDAGIWLHDTGSLMLLVREGNTAPGGGRFNNQSILSLRLNDTGHSAFSGNASGSSNTGIWSDRSGSLDRIVSEGNHAPGTPMGQNFGPLPSALSAMNSAGRIAFEAGIAGVDVDASNDRGVWSEGSGALTLFAREGDQAAGAASGVEYRLFDGSSITLNDSGQTAFMAFLSDINGNSSSDVGIWSDRTGSLAPVALSGDPAPNLPSGLTFAGLDHPVLNDFGQVAFSARVTGTGVTISNDWGYWSEGSGALSLVAREGDQAADMPTGVSYAALGSRPAFNNSGEIAFSASLAGSGVDGTNNSGIWSGSSESLALVARTGSRAPETPAGTVFSSLSLLPSLNDLGQVAFFANLTGSAVTSSNDRGLWATDSNGNVILIAREGDTLEVASGVHRTVESISFSGNTGNGDGRRSAFSDAGQLAFFASFTDGSEGVFVADIVAKTAFQGDFNADGAVDAADYTVWRDNLNASVPLPGDPTPGSVTPDDYFVWRNNFGAQSPPPEPIELIADADTNVEEHQPNDIEGGLSRMQVRSRNVSGTGRQNVSYIRFDLEGETDISDAVFTLVTSNTTGWVEGQVQVYGLNDVAGNTTQDWLELGAGGLTFNTTGAEIPGDGNAETQDLGSIGGTGTENLWLLGDLPGLESNPGGASVDFSSTELTEFLNSRSGGLATLLLVGVNGSDRELLFSTREVVGAEPTLTIYPTAFSQTAAVIQTPEPSSLFGGLLAPAAGALTSRRWKATGTDMT